jgi:hypothetical protein
LFLGFISIKDIGVVWAYVIGLVLYAALLDAFSESPVAGASHAGFVAYVPKFFRTFARAFYPGWMWGAFFFTLIVFFVTAGIFVTLELTKSSFQQQLRDSLQTLLNATLGVWYSFICGALLGNVIFRRTLPSALTIFLYHSLTLVMGVLFFNMVEKSVIHQSLWWISAVLFPFAVVFYPGIDSSGYAALGIAPAIVTSVSGVALLFVLHFLVRPEREKMKHLEITTREPVRVGRVSESQKVELR